jgi:dTDP-4-amino-4,6-dideoxygalactose transaminase
MTFPLASHLSSEILSLPMYPGLTETEQHRVAEVIASFPATL